MVPQKDAENTMDTAYKQQRSFKEKNGNKQLTYTKNQKETAETSQTHNEEGRLGEFDTHRAYRNRKGWEKAAEHRLDELVCSTAAWGCGSLAKCQKG